jgi:hypothetical protein
MRWIIPEGVSYRKSRGMELAVCNQIRLIGKGKA